jgi:hypothetical protein
MAKQLTKSGFGVPSIALSCRIDDSDRMSALDAAHYRVAARLRELECEFEVKAAEIRKSYLAEVDVIQSGGAE